MIGKTISHYKILAKLGEGGMGVVYKAEDTKLERLVAIKFLPSHIAANDDERHRIKVEAKAAAALNLPNIATIHAIEEADGHGKRPGEDHGFRLGKARQRKGNIKKICKSTGIWRWAKSVGHRKAQRYGVVVRLRKSSKTRMVKSGKFFKRLSLVINSVALCSSPVASCMASGARH